MNNEATTQRPTTRPTTGNTLRTPRPPACTPADRVTKSLLGYGVIAGPFYLVVALTQALTRDGFDLARHQWSLLANGGPGWIQIVNFVVTGLMVMAFAVGLRRALTPGSGARWAPRLVGIYGASLIAAGVFRADPALGFPAGTPDGPGTVSWHGLLHFAAGGVGFSCLAIACFVIARRYSAEGRRGLVGPDEGGAANRQSGEHKQPGDAGARLFSALLAGCSRVTGIVFVATFGMLASSGGLRVANLVFTAAVIGVWAWLSAVAVNRYRQV